MSVGTIALFVNWLLEGELKVKIKTLLSNRLPLAVISVFLIHVIGLLWTTDFYYAINDLRIKLPLLIFALVLGSKKVLIEDFKKIFLVFISATVASCLISVWIYIQGKLGQKNINNIRDISIFISHIRLSLMAVFSIVGSWYFLLKKELKAVYVYALSVFLFLFLILLQSVTGILLTTLFIVFFPVLLLKVNKKNIIISFLMLSIVSIGAYVVSKPFYEWYFVPVETKISSYTKEGNLYDTTSKSWQLENGYYVWKNINHKELAREWNKISSHRIDSIGENHHTIKAALIRYLTGKHLTKDAEGIQSLSESDIKKIEEGVANPNEYSSVLKRVDEFFFETAAFLSGQNPSENSFSQRLYAWQIALLVLKDKKYIGVGTGDVQMEYNHSYESSEFNIIKKIRAHNQFITFVIAFGILSVFPIVAFLFFTFKNSSYHNKLKFLYVLIVLYSFMFEDTLETQAGVTFVAFFMGLFSSPKLET